ncbi:MAG: endonuclease/exonuclease/phosphatase family protein [Gammaproteobacteria bacterium]|nr:endonuclease/exonuclease/phosphatase family protein [Gammaproteobacteria bacterium]
MVTTADERRFFHILIRLVFAAAAFSTVIALFARWFWFAELFSHFRLYYLLLLAVLIPVFLYGRYFGLMVASGILLIPNAWVVVPYLATIIGEQEVGDEAAIHVVAANLNYKIQSLGRLNTYLIERSPDLIVFSEITPPAERALRGLGDSYRYQAGQSRTDPWGLKVYSRLPIRESELLSLSLGEDIQVRVRVETAGGLIDVFAVHFYSPISADMARSRNAQMMALSALLKASDVPQLVIGDMNVTPFSPVFARFMDESGLVDARLKDGYHITWPTSALPLWIPIDHALAGNGLDVSKVQTGPNIGSDHYPIEVTINSAIKNPAAD